MMQTTIFDQAQTTNRKPTQGKRMLALLRERGKYGIRNYEFVTLLSVLNYKGRVHELRRDGWDIRINYTPQHGKGVYTYVLMPESQQEDLG